MLRPPLEDRDLDDSKDSCLADVPLRETVPPSDENEGKRVGERPKEGIPLVAVELSEVRGGLGGWAHGIDTSLVVLVVRLFEVSILLGELNRASD